MAPLTQLLALVAFGLLAGPLEGFKVVNDVKSVMYIKHEHTGGCYKLLNINGEVGCAAPVTKRTFEGRPRPESVEGPLWHVEAANQQPPKGSHVAVVAASLFEPLMQRLLVDEVLRARVLAVLVDTSSGLPESQSSAPAFPNSWNAPYPDKDHSWNPWGTGLASRMFGLPVVQLPKKIAGGVAERARYNTHTDYASATEWAEVSLTMEAEGTAEDCLIRAPQSPDPKDERLLASCQPIGGWTVWSAMPPLGNGPQRWSGNGPLREFGGPLRGNDRPITLVAAQVDTGSFFHDDAQAAGAPRSGLVAMLTAMDILRRYGAAGKYTRQLVFTAITGEPWDYMGSRRLIYEIDLETTAVRGLEIALIDQVIELGMLGRATSKATNETTLYAHTQRGAGFGDASELVSALQQAGQDTTRSEIKVAVQPASASNPGVPPSSLMSFLRRKPSIKGVVLTEFDSQYINPYVHSTYDSAEFVELEALVSAALVLARTLHDLARDGAAVEPLEVDPWVVRTTALDLATCLMLDDGQQQCALAQAMMNLDTRRLGDQRLPHFPAYVGVLNGLTNEATNITYKPNVYRFLYNFMANASAVGEPKSPCDPTYNYCPAGEACVFWKSGSNPETQNETMGRCRDTTVAFVPAFSTRLWFNDTPNANDQAEGWRLRLWDDNAEYNQEYGWPADALWTESNWPNGVPRILVYLRESRETKVACLISGLLLTVATGLVSWYARHAFEKHLQGL